MESVEYLDISNKNFYKSVRSNFSKYKIRETSKSAKELCRPKKFKLQKPQRFVSAFLSPKTKYRNLLIFHKIGSGKTCASITVAEKWKRRRRILVITSASLIDGYRDELRSKCVGDTYITDENREKLKQLQHNSKEYKRIIKESDKLINVYYDIISYQKFIKISKKIKLNKSVIIIDEVQNIVSEKGSMYKILYEKLEKVPPSTPIVLLTATPMFDKPVELALTLNLFKLPQKIPVDKEFNNLFLTSTTNKYGDVEVKTKNLNLLKKYIRGYISYYRGANPKTFPKKNIIFVDSKMSDFQYKCYISVLAKEGSFTQSDIFNASNNFFIASRSISNIAFPNKKLNEEGFVSFRNKYLKGEGLKQCSKKFYDIVRNIKKTKGPVFVYSNFKNYAGIRTFTKILEAYGYKNYNTNGAGKNTYAIWSGDETLSYRAEIKNVFNKYENKNGDLIKIFIGTPAIKEGVSLFRIRQVHIIEPYWNYSRLEQIIGRAFRYCSHIDLPKNQQSVDVFLYRSVYEDIQTIDKYIYELARKKKGLIDSFMNVLKMGAVDCSLNYVANSIDDDIRCVR